MIWSHTQRPNWRPRNLDMIVANLIGAPEAGFQADTNRATLFFRDGRQEQIELMPKIDLAGVVLDRICALIASAETPA